MKKLFCALLLLVCGTASAQILCPSGYNFNGLCLSNPKGTAILGGQDGTGVNGKGGSITIVPGAPTGSSTAVGDFTLQLDPTNPNVNFKCTNPTVGGVNTASCAFNGMAGIPLSNLANTFSATSILRARDYGVSPTNTAVQNDAAFLTLKAAMQASSTTIWRVIFEPGAYVYTNNRWLFGVRNVIIEAYGASFQSTSIDANSGNQIPLMVNDPFDDSGDMTWPHLTYVNGDLINTANAGSSTVTTTTAGNAAHYSAGNEVLISGYDQQQSGYPPNLRYFEYAYVSSVNVGTGVVTLTAPIKNFYDSRWWDTSNYGGTGVAYGAPRILNLNRTNYNQANLVWIKGANFLANSITPASYTVQIPANILILEEVQGVGFNIVENDNVIIERGSFIGNVSTCDKLVNFMLIDNTLIQSSPGSTTALTDCVGVNNLALNNNRINGQIYQISPRHLIMNNNDVIPPASSFSGIATASNNPVSTVGIANTRISNTGLTYGFSNVASPGNAFTVGSVTGTTLKMTWNGAAMAVANQIEYGMGFTDTTQSCTGVITGIFLTGGNLLNITQTGCAVPLAGDTINYYDVIKLFDEGGNSILGPTQVPFFRNPPSVSLPSPAEFTGDVTIDGNLIISTNQRITFNGIAGTFFVTDASNGVRFFEGNTQVMQLLATDLIMYRPIALNELLGSSFNRLYSPNAPTISSGFGTSPSVSQNNGTASFSINVGTGGSATSGVIALPTAAHAWMCAAADTGATPTGRTDQTAGTTTTVTLTNYSRTTGLAVAWTASEIVQVSCFAN